MFSYLTATGLGLEKDVADRSLNSWRTTWEPDTLLETPEVATIGRSIIEDVAFPSAISAMNELAPRTPGDVNLVAENLANSRSRLDLQLSSSHLDSYRSDASAENDRTALVDDSKSSWLPESWRDVMPQCSPNLPESWRDVVRTSI